MIKIIGVTAEPITLEEAKLHVRVDGSLEDTLIDGLITAAREYCENYTGRSFASQSIEYFLNAFPSGGIDLPRKPIDEVTSICYKDQDGVETALVEGVDYILDVDSARIALPYGKVWPSFTPYPLSPIKIEYSAGGTASIPGPVKTAMLLLIGHWYENREAVLTGSISKQIEFSTKALLDQYRDRWWD